VDNNRPLIDGYYRHHNINIPPRLRILPTRFMVANLLKDFVLNMDVIHDLLLVFLVMFLRVNANNQNPIWQIFPVAKNQSQQ
jgi:hypothetical protein